MQILQKLLLIFTIIGALNWGFIGLFNVNLVESLFSFSAVLLKIIYIIVGISGLINIGIFFMDLVEK